jgi:hypothetical protein
MLRTKLKAARTSRPRSITAFSIFFAAGATISFIAGISLLRPNTFLEPIWRANPHAHENLSSLGLWAVLLLSTVSMLCAAAAIGLWRGSRWGYWLAVGLILTNLLGNVINVALGTEPRAIVGVPIAAALLAYLIMSKKVQEFFSKSKN